MKVVTRFAPSPTGFLHLGGARTALFNYLFTKQNNGKFILRIEDTDKERSKKEYEDDILEGIKWLGLNFDEMYRQSDRKEIYKKYIEKLISENKAYISKEENREGGRSEVVRFKNPNIKIKFKDVIRGEVEFDTTELNNFVIAKSLGEPLYHLAVVIDDFEMNVTHIIRGEDHISNTPRQILIQKALDFPEVVYAHIPLILAEDRSKLSKRKHGESVSLNYYQKEGILPQAMNNYLALLGWNPGDDREILSMEEVISSFNLEKVQKGGAIFNTEKLEWLNAQYIKNMSAEESQKKIKDIIESNKKESWKIDDDVIEKISPVILERVRKWSDVKNMISEGELDYFFEKPILKAESLIWKKSNNKNTQKYLEKILEISRNLEEKDFNAKILREKLMEYADEKGRGDVLWPTRFALTGRDKSPDSFIISEILGKKESIKRWQEAIETLKKQKQ